jgi:predicted negative regulator of RcsB-dependent stress response
MKIIEQMSAEELREIVYSIYSTLETAINEPESMNIDEALPLLISALDHVQEDPQCAKIAILCYSNLTLQLGREVKALTLENIALKKQLPLSS